MGAVEPSEELTPRELQVLQLVTTGLSNRAIGEALFISPHTAKIHVERILRKLGVSSRVEAAVWLVRKLTGAPGPRAGCGSTSLSE